MIFNVYFAMAVILTITGFCAGWIASRWSAYVYSSAKIWFETKRKPKPIKEEEVYMANLKDYEKLTLKKRFDLERRKDLN